jgi:hypothetical protein
LIVVAADVENAAGPERVVQAEREGRRREAAGHGHGRQTHFHFPDLFDRQKNVDRCDQACICKHARWRDSLNPFKKANPRFYFLEKFKRPILNLHVGQTVAVDAVLPSQFYSRFIPIAIGPADASPDFEIFQFHFCSNLKCTHTAPEVKKY